VFVKLGWASDGRGVLQGNLQASPRGRSATRPERRAGRSATRPKAGAVARRRPARPLRRYTLVPSEDQTSIFVRTRETTSLVNPDVVAWPPRSGVRTPAALASRTAS
jgi:hypothetical protein